VFGSNGRAARVRPERAGRRSDGFGEQRVVEDYSANAEDTPAEYTRTDHTGDGAQDLRPEPAADFRTEVRPQEFPTAAHPAEFSQDTRPAELSAEAHPTAFPGDARQAEFSGEARPVVEPLPRMDPGDYLSPSLPIPMPEPPASGYRPTPRPGPYGYRSELERAATDLPAGPPSPEPGGTAYFGAAPAVGNFRYAGENSSAWGGDRYAAEPPRDERPAYGGNPAAEWGTGNSDVAGTPRNEGDGRADGDSTSTDQRTTDQRATEQRATDQPALHQPVHQQPAYRQPPPQQPAQQQRIPEQRTEGASPVTDLGDAWTRVLAGLPPNQRAWLTNSRPVTLHESTAIVAVPDDFTRGQLETRLRPDLERILSESFGRDIRIAVTVDPSLDPEVREAQSPPPPVVREPLRTDGAFQPTIQSALTEPDPGPQFGQPQPVQRYEQPAPQHYEQPAPQRYDQPAPQAQQPFGAPASPLPNGSHPVTEAQGEARLNPKYTFETFVIGSSNRFAHAAAVAVAEAPGKAYNPQLIYGDSGLGKTHLLHAIGHYVRSLYTGARVRYVSSEEFTNDFINAIRDDKASQFQRRYRDVDVLLIDDIQFLEGKIQTQEEFFHTFNTLHNANKQIVISSDRAPKRLEALEDRLRNRFEWGLITDIQPPDLETRIAILRKKAATERLTAPPEVLEFIASKVQTNIRELEGALIRVTAFASLNRQPVDLSLAEIVLKDLIPEGSKPEVTASMIMGQTASYFGLSIDDLCGSSRSRVLVTARQIAMYLCRELTDLSLPKIGQQFGGRDHTTVMHAERKIRQLMSERRSVFNQVTELTNRIKHQAKQQ